MNVRSKSKFCIILSFLLIISLCFSYKIDSYAASGTTKVTFTGSNHGGTTIYAVTMYLPNGYRYAFSSDNPYYIWSNGSFIWQIINN